MVHRRLLALAPIALMATAMAFGAAQTEAAMGGGVAVTPPGTLPIVEEKITLRVGAIPHPTVVDLATNYATQWMEEQTNIHVEWDVFPAKDAKEKINLLLASGSDLPEVFLGLEGAVSRAAHAVRSTGIVPAARRLLGRAGLLHHGVL